LTSIIYKELFDFIRSLYPDKNIIALHEPSFGRNEKKYLSRCVDSTYVSSVGPFVSEFEDKVARFTGSKYAIATVNGTAALSVALIINGVVEGDEVITQPLSFIATANSIKYVGAEPVFIDVDRDVPCLSPDGLEQFLIKNTNINKKGECININTSKRIKACMPVHVFGHPGRMERITDICKKHNIILIEDAAEAVGSYIREKHVGTFGACGILSFNGNKIITTGGGGMILTSSESLANKARHLTTQAKIHHPWEYIHDQIGYNYRLPNINAALGLAQMEILEILIAKKRNLAKKYMDLLKNTDLDFLKELPSTRSNYWLNTILMNSIEDRDNFLEYAHQRNILCRPCWKLAVDLDMYENAIKYDLSNCYNFYERVINLPSSIPSH